MSAKITPSNVRSFVSAYSTILAHKLKIKELENFELVQLELRKKLCSDCVKAAKCVGCGCKVPDLFWDKSREDALNKWGPMLNEKQWDAFISSLSNETISDINQLASFYSLYYKHEDENITVHNVVYNSILNVGQIKANEQWEQEVSIVNNTSLPFIVDEIKPGCSCTAIADDKKIIDPDQSFSFKVSYDTSRIGKFTVAIKITAIAIGSRDHINIPTLILHGEVIKQ